MLSSVFIIHCINHLFSINARSILNLSAFINQYEIDFKLARWFAINVDELTLESKMNFVESFTAL